MKRPNKQAVVLALLVLTVPWSTAQARGPTGGPSCPGDVDADGVVDMTDLTAVITAWGSTSPAADVNGDGTVDVLDLVEILLLWGSCPTGACCLVTNECVETTANSCNTVGGDYMGDGIDCTGIACALPCAINAHCEPDEFCWKPPGQCGAVGECMVRPDFCVQLWDPVCGCDDQTYSNECVAHGFGVNVAYYGPCQ